MINFYLYNFILGKQFLQQAVQSAAGGIVSRQYEIVPPADHDRIAREVRDAIKYCVESISLYEAGNTAIEIENMLSSYPAQDYNWRELHTLLVRLRDQIEREIGAECFFHYDREDARTLVEIPQTWALVISAFPSSQREIMAALDCRALGDYPGCIFHMLRVAETGLRAVARERGVKSVRGNKPIEYAMWGEVIGSLHVAIDAIRTARGNKKTLTVKRRANREIAVEFYSTIMGDMQALLPLRDRTIHLRDTYDKGEAWTAIHRTREMMSKIATKLGETTTGKIKWGL
jgi:hypothetical protein